MKGRIDRLTVGDRGGEETVARSGMATRYRNRNRKKKVGERAIRSGFQGAKASPAIVPWSPIQTTISSGSWAASMSIAVNKLATTPGKGVGLSDATGPPGN